MKLSLLAWLQSRIRSIETVIEGDPLALFTEGRIDAYMEVMNLLEHLVDPTEDPLSGVKSFRDLDPTGENDPNERIEEVEGVGGAYEKGKIL